MNAPLMGELTDLYLGLGNCLFTSPEPQLDWCADLVYQARDVHRTDY